MIDELKKIIKEGHFVLASGRHSNVFFDKRELSKDREKLESVSGDIYEKVKKYDVDIIISPEKGAVPFGEVVASNYSGNGKIVKFIRAQKDKNNNLYFGPETKGLIREKNIGIVEDIFTTGRSVKKIIDLIKENNGKVIFIAGILDRSDGVISKEFSKYNFEILDSTKADSWKSSDCLLCYKGIPIDTDFGHGSDFLKNTND